MKTTLTTILIITGIILFTGCVQLSNSHSAIDASIIWDITDSMMVTPKLSEITSLYGLDKDIWNGGKFRLLNVTDVSINKIYEASIESENMWLGNKFKRNEKLKKFYSEIDGIISGALKQKIGKDNTSLYIPIAKELNRLSQSTANKKLLLVYSDLMQNTDDMSFYKNETLSLLRTNPDSVKKYFESQLKLKNLSGIKIYLVFQPQNMKQDEVYKIVSNFYKAMLESKGAEVEITASIN